jgi:protein pelota
MKILKKQIEKCGSGLVILNPENSEDMWHAYNLIVVGDQVRTTTFR